MSFSVPWSCFDAVPLKHLAHIRSSNVDKVVDESETPVRLCNYVDVYYHERITEEISFSAGSANQREIKRFSLREGDVIITKDSESPDDIAVSALVESSATGVVCGYHLALIRPYPSRVRGDFLFWCMSSAPVRATFTSSAQGITRFGLTYGAIGAALLPAPDLATQKRIANFLDRETARIDQLIEKKQRLVELLGEKQHARVTSLVTQGLDSTVRNVPTGIEWLPEAPEHWQFRRIASIFHEVYEAGVPELPVLSVSIHSGISDRQLEDEERDRKVVHIEDKTAYKRVRPGDLVYNMMRAWQGAFGVATVDGLVSPAYVTARPDELIHSPYFEALLRTPMCIEEFRRASKGIADFRQRLYWEHFRQVRVPLPPLDEQLAIADRVKAESNTLGDVVKPVQSSIDLLQEFRSALITAAVTGQIDVDSWSRRGSTDQRLEKIEEEMRV